MIEKDATAPLKRLPLIFILITLLVDAMGFGLIIPVMPALLEELIGQSSDVAAKWGGYLTFVYAAMHLLFEPLIGNLSDRFGRRPVLLASLASLFVDYLIMGFANSSTILFLGRLLAGICGASFAPLTEKQVINRSFYFHVRGSSLLFIYGCLDLSRLAHFVRPRT